MRVSAALLCLVLTGCSPLVNLSQLEVKTWPSAENQVLAAGDTVRVSFSEAVDKPSAEPLLSVSSVDGVTPGDLSWSGRTLTFTPVPPLVPSKRYNLEFSGQVTLTDGRQFNVVKEVPFFSVSAASGLLLASYSPANGATTDLTTPLVLVFDQAVDPASFTQGFSLSPTATYTTAWSSDAKTVTITPQAWTGNTLVSWQLSTSVKAATGVPLTASVSKTFLTNADQTLPAVISLVPAVSSGSNPVLWSAAGSDLNMLQKGDGLLLTVSEPVTSSSLSAALHLTPTVKGHWEAQNTTSAPYEYVYVPEDDWTPGTAYSLQLTGLQDASGNTRQPYLASFTPAIPYLQVTGITLTGTSAANYGPADLSQPNIFPVCVPSGVSGALQIAVTLQFSAPFSATDKTQFAVDSFCEPLFPTEGAPLATPTLVTISFLSDSAVVLTYQGFSVATPSAPDYYRIRIPGGPAGLKTQAGNVLKEDVWLDFVTG
jgi:hypothetical protein